MKEDLIKLLKKPQLYFDPRICQCGSDEVHVGHTRQSKSEYGPIQERQCKKCGRKFDAITIRCDPIPA